MTELPAVLAASALAGALLELLQTAGAMASLKESTSGRYLWANDRWAAFATAHARAGAPAWQGATDVELWGPELANAVRAADQRAVQAGMPSAGEHRLEHNGRKVELRVLRQAVPVAEGVPVLLTLWWDDSAARQAAEQLKLALAQVERQQGLLEQATSQQQRDRPTELFRREQFEEHLRREWALSTREHREFALVLLSIDGLADRVAQRGAAVADLLPRAVAQLLRTSTRAMDVISPVAPGRLAVLLSGVGLGPAPTRRGQIRRPSVAQVVVHEGAAVPFTVSVGIASFPHTADTLEAVSTAAERSLQQAEQRGGNRVVLASIPLGQLKPVGREPDER
jgi:diguanylate cyclase (GGDEF)-like protein